MIARRSLLAGLGVATLALGFDLRRRTWITSAEAAERVARVPRLDGVLVMDPAALAAMADDVGNIVRNTPIAILRPETVEDISRMVEFCARYGIKVAARGQGHTTFGQSQVAGGLIVEMATLNEIHSIGAHIADIDAGAIWKDLITQSFARGLTPPVITGFTGLSIGGTLSVGGVSPANEAGAQVDHVRELQVVTGKGDIEWCSRRKRPELFEAVLAGLGQYGIITRAIIDLVPARANARTFQLAYTDNATFFADLRTLLARREFDRVYNIWFPNPAGGWIYQLNAVKFFDESSAPDNTALLRGLQAGGLAIQPIDTTYLQSVFAVDDVIDIFKAAGVFNDVVHPWFDVFLPGSATERYLGEVLPTLTPEDVGPTGFMLLFPLRRSALTRPFLRVPEGEEWVYLFDILTAAPLPGPNAAFAARMLDRNRQLYDKAAAVGGTRYPIGSLEFSQDDWAHHYGHEWREAIQLKRGFDPSSILTPGPGIFRK